MTRVYSQTIGGVPSSPLLPAPVTSLHTNTTVGHSTELGDTLEQPVRSNFAATTLKCCGIFQVCLGIFAVTLGAAAWAVQDGLLTYMFSGGFIAGFFLIIGGSLGIDSTRTEKTSIIVACLVMSVFSAFFGFLYLGISCASLWVDFTPEMDIWEEAGPIGIIDAFGTFVGLAGVVVAIIQVVICSQTVCGCCAGCCVKETALGGASVSVNYSIDDPSSTTSTSPLLPSLAISTDKSTQSRRGYGSAQRQYTSMIV